MLFIEHLKYQWRLISVYMNIFTITIISPFNLHCLDKDVFSMALKHLNS